MTRTTTILPYCTSRKIRQRYGRLMIESSFWAEPASVPGRHGCLYFSFSMGKTGQGRAFILVAISDLSSIDMQSVPAAFSSLVCDSIDTCQSEVKTP